MPNSICDVLYRHNHPSRLLAKHLSGELFICKQMSPKRKYQNAPRDGEDTNKSNNSIANVLGIFDRERIMQERS